MKSRMGLFKTTFVLCTSSLPPSERPRAAIAAVLAVGCEFRFGLDPNTDPYSRIDPKWGVHTMTFRHPAIQADGSYVRRLVSSSSKIVEITKAEGPVADFDYLYEHDSVSVWQSGNMDDLRLLDEMALGQLLLATDLQPHLRPGYGWLDESGGNHPDIGAMAPGSPEYLFWANFFGPEHANAIGRDFLSAAPGWRLVDFPDGSVLYVATQSYSDWRFGEAGDVLAYFRQRIPTIEPYRAEKISD